MIEIGKNLNYLLIEATELIELSYSKREMGSPKPWTRRIGAGDEVNGKPVREWNTILAAESKRRRKRALSFAVGIAQLLSVFFSTCSGGFVLGSTCSPGRSQESAIVFAKVEEGTLSQ